MMLSVKGVLFSKRYYFEEDMEPCTVSAVCLTGPNEKHEISVETKGNTIDQVCDALEELAKKMRDLYAIKERREDHNGGS